MADIGVNTDVILERLNTLVKGQHDLNIKLDKLDNCLQGVNVKANLNEQKIANNKEDIDRLEKRINAWGGLNSIGALIAGLLGTIGIKQ